MGGVIPAFTLMPSLPPVGTRRPIKARDSQWAAATAKILARSGLRPNQISILSAVFAAFSGVCFAASVYVSKPWMVAAFFMGAAACVQLRLLCNLFDGMVAVEGGFRTKSGEIFNELPDRFADAFTLVGCGYAASLTRYGVELGWIAALLAVITAYVRTLGAATGAGQSFIGPMAKQHRMATVTVASLLGAGAAFFSWQGEVMRVALAIIVLGTIVTIFRRVGWVIRTLEAK